MDTHSVDVDHDRRVAFVVPGDLEARTGGYGYDRRIIAGLCGAGWTVNVVALDGSYPFPTSLARLQTSRALASLDDDHVVIVDGLAFGAMADEAERERRRLRLAALVHHPLAAETGLSPGQIETLVESERRALACTRAVVVTSRATVGSLAAYGIESGQITVIEPGTDLKPLARGSNSGGVLLLCVASVSPRKGHETLIEALSELRDLPWALRCVGSVDRDRDTAERLRRQITSAGLGDRVQMVGELGEASVDDCYDSADLFVLPTFHEGYGMAVAEAIAHGLPVISTATGAIAELVSDEAGLLVAPGDVEGLRSALRRVLTDADYLETLAAGARRRRQALPSWEASTRRFATLLSQLRS